MGRRRKLYDRIVGGGSDTNVPFAQMRGLLRHLGFSEDTEGDHFIFRKEGIPFLINLQPDGAKCKPYQVKQVRRVLIDYGLKPR